MDLVRLMLLQIEEYPHGHAPQNITVEGYTQEQVGYHAVLMIEGGLVRGVDTTHFGALTPSAQIERLTWKGHEFLDAARQLAIWERAKNLAARAGSSSFTVLVEALTKLAIEALGS